MATTMNRVKSPVTAVLTPLQQAAMVIFGVEALLWGVLFVRWATFGTFGWTAWGIELALAEWSPLWAYAIYGVLGVVDVVVAVGLWRQRAWASTLGVGRSVVVLAGVVVYFLLTQEFWGAALILALAGFTLTLLLRSAAWSLAYPSAFWLAIFFVTPMLIVFFVSLGDRSRLGTVTYPAFTLTDLGVYFDDYGRFFSAINGDYIYLRIFARSLWLATLNTAICLVVGYPFAYWIARQPVQRRGLLIFLVMIPFWTNFLVRTYAWMLILRDSGLINNFWTGPLHDWAAATPFLSGLAVATKQKLPLLFNQTAVVLGLFYGFLPFMILPLYSNLEKIDWSLLEAAADLGANAWQSTVRVLIPLTMPGIVAGSIIVFIPSLGAYVTPDLMGGAKVSLLGNLLQQQFMSTRDWPFGSAIGFLMMAIMLVATLFYFRISAASEVSL